MKMADEKKILITDGFDADGVKFLEGKGFDVDLYGSKNLITPEKLLSTISKYDGLIVRSATKVTRDVIEAGANGGLRIIGRSGVGVDNIDCDAASEYGIVVKNAPNGNSLAVAELTIGLIISLSRGIPRAYKDLYSGTWSKMNGSEISGKTLGIIGCGNIGKQVAQMARRGFNMHVLGYDKDARVSERDQSGNIEYVGSDADGLYALLESSDYVSLHIPKPDNPIMNGHNLTKMKKGAYLINTARGSCVDELALCDALKKGKIAGAASDVFSGEGDRFSGGELIRQHNFIGLPHLGASTSEAQYRTSMEMADVIAEYFLNGSMKNAVNFRERKLNERELYTVLVFHDDKPGALSDITRRIGDYGINIVDAPLYGNGKKAMARIRMESPLNEEQLHSIGYIDGVDRVIGF